MNFYASQHYLDVIQEVYFPGKRCRVRDYDVHGRCVRLLDVNGEPLLEQRYLDMHEALAPEDSPRPEAKLGYLPKMTLRTVRSEDYDRTIPETELIAAPYTLWSEFETWDDYLAFLKKRSSIVKDDARRRRKLAKEFGELTFQVHDGASDVLPFAVRVKGEQMQETLGLNIFDNPANEEYFRALDRRGLLKASTLRVDGRLLAVWLGVIHQERWTGWIFAREPSHDFRKYSVGRQLLYFMLEESYGQGHHEFDFSLGGEEYKWYFSTHARCVGALGTPPLKHRVKTRVKRRLKRELEQRPWLAERTETVRSLLRQRRL